jgi:hypothetical protein
MKCVTLSAKIFAFTADLETFSIKEVKKRKYRSKEFWPFLLGLSTI